MPSTTRYEERVEAPSLLWLFVVVLSGSLGLAYGAALGVGWGLLAFGLSQALSTWWMLSLRARVAVEDGVLVAGRARLPLEFVGTVLTLDATETAYAAGPGADARAYLVLRGTDRPSVKVVLDDPADPTPYWLIVSRDPARLRDAIIAGRDAGRDAHTGAG